MKMGDVTPGVNDTAIVLIPKIDKPELLNETSVLMTQHVMQGRDIEEVIDELEVLFRRFYDELVNSYRQG